MGSCCGSSSANDRRDDSIPSLIRKPPQGHDHQLSEFRQPLIHNPPVPKQQPPPPQQQQQQQQQIMPTKQSMAEVMERWAPLTSTDPEVNVVISSANHVSDFCCTQIAQGAKPETAIAGACAIYQQMLGQLGIEKLAPQDEVIYGELLEAGKQIITSRAHAAASGQQHLALNLTSFAQQQPNQSDPRLLDYHQPYHHHQQEDRVPAVATTTATPHLFNFARHED